MSQFHAQVDLNGVTAYPGTAQVQLGFTADEIRFQDESATVGFFYSFDGTTDHGYVSSKAGDFPISYQKATKLWLRAQSNPGAAMLVHVTAQQFGRG